MSEAPAAAPPFRVQAVEYPRAMAELHGIREAVFVREQQVPAELERDALFALHAAGHYQFAGDDDA